MRLDHVNLDTLNMIELRDYQKTDLEAYVRFSKRNFDARSYQSNIQFLSWLEKNSSRSLKIALYEGDIIGCSHGYEVPISSEEKTVNFFIVHDIMTDKKHRTAGIKLIKDSVLRNQPVLLSGASGKISEMYKRIGATKMSSFWYRKVLLPKKRFKKDLILRNERLKLNDFPGFSIYSNKAPENRTEIKKFLKKFQLIEEQENFLCWRFFEDNAPINYFLSTKDNSSGLIFSIGRSKFFPIIRIFSISAENKESKIKLIKCVEKFAKENGIFIILISLITRNPLPKELNYKPYNDMPDVYWFSKDKTKSFAPIVEGLHTDMGFNGYI